MRPFNFICRNSLQMPGTGTRTPIVSFPGADDCPAIRLVPMPGRVPQFGASGAQMWV